MVRPGQQLRRALRDGVSEQRRTDLPAPRLWVHGRRPGGNGELVIEKVLKKGPLPDDGATDILALDRASYPRFYDGVRVAKYCVPIQGTYHEKLFPEISFQPQLPLFAAGGIARGRTVTGDILFYPSRDRRLAASQSLTTVRIVEQCRGEPDRRRTGGDNGATIGLLGC